MHNGKGWAEMPLIYTSINLLSCSIRKHRTRSRGLIKVPGDAILKQWQDKPIKRLARISKECNRHDRHKRRTTFLLNQRDDKDGIWN